MPDSPPACGARSRVKVWFDPASRGRYSTDASIYQVEPIGVVAPRSAEDIARTIAICREAGAPVLPRGAGTSQCGQTVGEAVVVDTSKHLDRVLGLDEESRRVTVEPGIVLDRLNAWLKPKGLFFPVDVSPANRATIGGMAGNNSCGSRSIRYGNMVHNVHAISAVLAGGSAIRFGEVSGNLAGVHRETTTTPISSGACARWAPAKRTRSRAGFRGCSEGSAATTSTLSCPGVPPAAWPMT